MHIHRAMFATVAIACLAGFFFVSAHTPTSTDHHQSAMSPAIVMTQDHHVFMDMYTWAALHLDEFREMPETFGGTEDWSEDWELHWMDVESRGGTVRIYHVSHKQHPERRLVSGWNEHEARGTDWLAAR